ncbi:MAG: hypothetical protein MAG794_00218 [Gammaproteobacteria bacterium]|nr:hypothetical protein [Gammaproteobacteria bacterium]
MQRAELTMGPALFNWKPETWRDFYFQVADESCVDTVYLGEIVCAKRTPFFEPCYAQVTERLQRAGKQVVFSTLIEVMTERERRITVDLCARDGLLVEANDAAALYHLRGKPHRVGPFVNTYNEQTLAFLAAKGAEHMTLPWELPHGSLAILAGKAAALDVTLEVPVYGRMPLALSARCYHARAHGRVKDNCQFVCDQDPDGMELKTLQGAPFLVINGIQTLSHTCLNLTHELPELCEMGIGAFRLSPHSRDMVETADLFRGVLDRRFSAGKATARLEALGLNRDRGARDQAVPFSNGFYHGQAGYQWVG